MPTFSEVITGYIQSLGTRHSAHRYTQVYQDFIVPLGWGLHDAADITRYQVILLAQRLRHIPSQCFKVVGLISQSYNWASCIIDPVTERPLYQGENPATHAIKAAKIPKPDPREVLMHHDEIARLLCGLDQLTLKYQAFLVTRLLTPCRLKELRTMRRDAVDLTTGKWLKRYTKNGKPQYILIPRQALELLRVLPHEGQYFFMGHYGQPLSKDAPRKVWDRYRSEIGLERIQLLDFRRTLATYLYTEIKADELTAKAVLNHYDGRPVAVYTRLNYDRLAEIIQRYADWVWKFRTPDDDAQLSLLSDFTTDHHATVTMSVGHMAH